VLLQIEQNQVVSNIYWLQRHYSVGDSHQIVFLWLCQHWVAAAKIYCCVINRDSLRWCRLWSRINVYDCTYIVSIQVMNTTWPCTWYWGVRKWRSAHSTSTKLSYIVNREHMPTVLSYLQMLAMWLNHRTSDCIQLIRIMWWVNIVYW